MVNTVKCLGHVNETRMNRGSRVECTIPIIHDGKELPDRRPVWEKTELFIWDSMYIQTMRLELIFDKTFEDLRDTRLKGPLGGNKKGRYVLSLSEEKVKK